MRLSLPIAACLPILLAAAGKRPAITVQGLKTPGIQIPYVSLKPLAEVVLDGVVVGLQVSGQQMLAVHDTRLDLIDVKTNQISDKPVPGLAKACGGMASGFESEWIPSCESKSLTRIETKTGKILATLAVGAGRGQALVATSADSVWMLSDERTTLLRIDPQDNAVVAEIRLPEACGAIAYGEAAIWIACPKAGRVLRVDAARNMVSKTIETAAKPMALAFGEGSVWVLCEGKVSRIDPKTNLVSATVELGSSAGVGGLAYGEGFLWVTMPGLPLTKIAAEGNKVMQQFHGSGGGGPIAVGFGSVWLGQDNKVLRFDPKRVAATLAEE